jgi:hypothetical protein
MLLEAGRCGDGWTVKTIFAKNGAEPERSE